MLGKKIKLLTITLLTLLGTTMLQATNTQYSATVCDGGTYLFGCDEFTPTTNGTGVHTDVIRPDSTVTLRLRFDSPVEKKQTATVKPGDRYIFGCDVIEAGADETTMVDVKTDVLQAACGCDSTVHLTLQVKKAPARDTVRYQYTEEVEATDQYLFGCQTLTLGTLQQLVASDTIPVSATKDSIIFVTLKLKQAPARDTVRYQYTAEVEATDQYLFGCQTLTLGALQQLVASDTIPVSATKDSIIFVTLKLKQAPARDTVRYQYEAEVEATDQYLFGCQTLTLGALQQLVASDTIPVSATKDSIIFVTLKLKPALEEVKVQYDAEIEVGDNYLFGCTTYQFADAGPQQLKDTIHLPGKDSIIFVNLTVTGGGGIQKDTVVAYTASIKPSEIYLFGCKQLTLPGEYKDTLQRANVIGDSITVLTLSFAEDRDTVRYQYEAEVDDANALYLFGCKTYSYGAETDNHTFSDTLAVTATKDSIIFVTLKLKEQRDTVRYQYEAEVDDANALYLFGCKTYSYGAETDNHTFSDTLAVTATKDSIIFVTLKLTAKPVTTGDTTAVECDQFEWYEWAGNDIITVSGDYQHTFVGGNQFGGDSIVTLHITINNSVATIADPVTECDSYYWAEADTTILESGTFTHVFQSAAGCDSTVTVTVTIHQSEEKTADAVVACESYYWTEADTTITTSGNYKHVFTNAAGCDSVVTLPVTINKATASEDTQVACESFDWNGQTYTASGDYVFNTTNAAGCDSIATLHLTINHASTGDTTAIECESFTWYGLEYNVSGDHQHTLTNAAGCDSVVTLHLTINHATAGSETRTECESFEWNGKTYDKSGDYQVTLTNAAGCDSVATLHLTILEAYSETISKTACDSYKWSGTEYTESGEYKKVFTAENGCDSVVTLKLTINHSAPKTVLYDTACVSYTWSLNGKEYTKSTVVSETLETVFGCDSVVELNLTILDRPVGDTAALECNLFTWRDVTYINDTILYDTLPGAAANGCDSIVRLTLTIDMPFQGELMLVPRYGDRILMINREEINKLPGWNLDLENDTSLVRWYREATPEDEFLGIGYYYTTSGLNIAPGVYYAKIEIPASEGARCGAKGETQHYTVKAKAGAPALLPTLARPGQDIQVINLDPEKRTKIRIFTSDGLLQGTYTADGETSFVIKAADNQGFYLVELTDEDMQTTLRYIVK